MENIIYSERSGSIKKTCFLKSKITFALGVLVEFLWLLGVISNNQNIIYVGFFASCLYCFFSPIKYGNLLIISFTIFEYIFTIFGDYGLFYLLVILVLKSCYKKRFRVCYETIIPLLIIVALNLVNDTIILGVCGKLLIIPFILFYFVSIFSSPNDFLIKPIEFLVSFGCSFLMMLWYLFGLYGGFSSFLDRAFSGVITRFGDQFALETGGAMGIPIYALMIISVGVVCLIDKSEKIGILGKIVVFFLMSVSLVFGFLTISRSFILGILVIILSLFFIRFKGAKNAVIKKLLVLASIVILTLVVFKLFPNLSKMVVDAYKYRIESDSSGGTGGRMEIYLECLSFLALNPIALLFGKGSYGYQVYGYNHNLLFSAGCHNFVLDILMSFGIIGLICVIYLVLFFIKKSRIISHIKEKPITLIPFLTVFSFSMTAMRTNSIKGIGYFFIAFIIIYFYGKERYKYDS